MVDARHNTDDPQALDEIAAALDDAEGVDGSRISLSVQDATVVLGGAVPSAEQASAAGLIAEQLTAAVRNELRVDPLLREDPTRMDAGPRDVGDESRGRGADLAMGEHGGELASDMDESLAENIPLDPPTEPVMVPTLDEQRGVVDGPASEEPTAEQGPLTSDEADQTSPSLRDMTATDLARSARPTSGGDDEEQ